MSHVTRTPLSRSNGQRSRSPVRFTHCDLNAWGRCSSDRENVLGVGNYCYVASARRCARPLGAHGGGEGRGHIVSPRTQLVGYYQQVYKHDIRGRTDCILIFFTEKVALFQSVTARHLAIESHPRFKFRLHLLQNNQEHKHMQLSTLWGKNWTFFSQ